MTTIAHTWHVSGRHLRAVARQPMYVAISLVQPMIYLLLFGALFQQVAAIPGFGSADYLSFLTPGIVVMGALFGGGWVGLGVIEDLDRGVVDRFLVSPLRRSALVAGLLVPLALVTVVQSLIVAGIAVVRGADLAGGLLGLLALLVSAVLLAAPFGALSCALALTLRQQESVVGLVQFTLMPLTFTAAAFMPRDLMPGWIRAVSHANPVDWSVTAAREAMTSTPDWGAVLVRHGGLLGFTLVAGWVALAALRRYQRTA